MTWPGVGARSGSQRAGAPMIPGWWLVRRLWLRILELAAVVLFAVAVVAGILTGLSR